VKILICCQNQFGYHSDTFYYSKFLSKCNSVDYVGWDYGKERMHVESVNVHYLSRKAGIIRRNVEYIKYCLMMISRSEYDVVFIKYFKGCSLLKLLHPNNIYIMDIRTAAVNNKKHIRVLEDCLLKLESKLFKNITVVSESLANKLNLKKYHVVPLGALPLCDRRDILVPNDELNLVYVGTFNGRQLEKTVEAIYLFRNRNPYINIRYFIIGDGIDLDKRKVLECIEKCNLKSVVSIEGFIPHSELKSYFESSHVGIAYIPVTDFYDVQPATKIYEYCLSSIPVLATNTTENVRVLKPCFGVTVADNPIEFSYGIERIIEKIINNELSFDDGQVGEFNWYSVVRDLEDYMINCKSG
jgi:hypothetical protein